MHALRADLQTVGINSLRFNSDGPCSSITQRNERRTDFGDCSGPGRGRALGQVAWDQGKESTTR